DLIEEHGFAAVTMTQVAERAGVTRRAVYLHFASRTELLTELFDFVNDTEDLAASTRPVWDEPDAVTALDEWARHLARYHPRLIGLARAADHARRSDPDAAAHWELVRRDWHDHCRRLAEWLDREGRLAPPWTVARATDMLWVLMSFDVLEGLNRRPQLVVRHVRIPSRHSAPRHLHVTHL
ncbi:MAG TPA: helix-turn-helix domain-containing protein, partial [Euzebyales bacterium]|nr:helix-turn-helix domain-containing protein [Euzebyales bacterium]